MASTFRRPHEVVDFDELTGRFPPPPEYFESAWLDTPDVIEAKQLARLRERAVAAARVPFFARRWAEAGFDPDGLGSLDDLDRVPAYTVDDIRASIEGSPPFGDYQGVMPGEATSQPMRLHTSGGTTGRSRPTLYTAWDREVGALLTARALFLQGIRPGDVVVNAWAYSMHNGAHIMDEALYKWLSCVVLTTGTGNVTPSRKQVELAHEYGATAILTTADYLLHLVDVAREMGLDPRTDLNIAALPNIGNRERLEQTFGIPVLESYGFHEVQWVAVECPQQDGLHIFEDAFVVQIVDVDTGEPLPDGEQGAICITELYKTGSPQFRYNIMDLSTLYPREQCACGSWLRKMAPFAGRGDNMVKLRGVNIWPEALGDVATGVAGIDDDYFVRAHRHGDRDEMQVSVVSRADPATFAELTTNVETALHDAIGVRIGAEVVAPGALDELTGFGSQAKLVRFRDDRP
ncbi:MAG: phenylacetate--CoA ligase family protein [Acidimicrobiales bacterium]